MKIQLIRHATLFVHFNGKNILVDPMLSVSQVMDPAQNAANVLRNPLVNLPLTVNLRDLKQADAVLLTHTHRDHFDEAAVALLPKSIPVFCQPEDKALVESKGFSQVEAINDETLWNGIRLIRTKGKHGTGELADRMGSVSGFVLSSTNEPSLYITGDSVWCPEVENALETYQPNLTVVFAGAAQFLTGGPITMTSEDIHHVYCKSPQSHIFVAHMEAWNHCLLTRNELKQYLLEKGISTQVTIPEDGEVLEYQLTRQ
jgi:L-ascorbate metabolism protein UlaG (beta-lactamase superfamily)